MRQIAGLITVLGVLALAGAAQAQGTEAAAPPRSVRTTYVLGTLGWNSLNATGVLAGYNVNPHLSLEGGFGFGAGRRLGVQARYNFLSSNLTPYLALGAQARLPINDVRVNNGNSQFTAETLASGYAVATTGLAYQSDGGFTMLLGLGYARRFAGSDYRIVEGTVSGTDRRALDIALGGGLVVALGLGYSF